MNLSIPEFRELLSRSARINDLVRIEGLGNELIGTSYNYECKLTTMIDAVGVLPAVSLRVEPIIKALQSRAPDLPISLDLDGVVTMLTHGEFRMQLQITGDIFEPIKESVPPDACVADEFIKRLEIVSSVVDKGDRIGVLISWDNENTTVAGMTKGPRHLHVSRWAEPHSSSGRICISKEAVTQILSMKGLRHWWVSSGCLYVISGSSILRVNQIRDSYPKMDLIKHIQSDELTMECMFNSSQLGFAIRSVMSVLTDDTNITMSCTGQLPNNGVLFEVNAKNTITKATASEKIIGSTMTPIGWTGRLNAKDLHSSLSCIGADSVLVRFCKKGVHIVGDQFIAYLAPMDR